MSQDISRFPAVALSPGDPCPPLIVRQDRWMMAKEAQGRAMTPLQMQRLERDILELPRHLMVVAGTLPTDRATPQELADRKRRNGLARVFGKMTQPEGAA